MGDDDETSMRSGDVDEQEANRGAVFQIERPEPLVGVERVDLTRRRGDRPPWDLHPGGHHLDGPAQVAVEEARPQVRMARQQHSGTLAQQLRVELVENVDGHGDHIGVLTPALAAVQLRQREQPLLQRAEGHHILDGHLRLGGGHGA